MFTRSHFFNVYEDDLYNSDPYDSESNDELDFAALFSLPAIHTP